MELSKKLLDLIYSSPKFSSEIAEDITNISISKNQGLYLSKLINKFKPKTVIELGFGYGVSTLWIQTANQKIDKHIVIDPDHHTPNNPIIYRVLKDLPNLEIIYSTSQQYLATLVATKQKADFVFIDADEKFDAITTDMYFVTQILNPSGIVVIRNVWNPSVRKAVEFFAKNLPYQLIALSKLEEFVVKRIPFIGKRLLHFKHRRTDLFTLKLKKIDNRPWNHFNHFSVVPLVETLNNFVEFIETDIAILQLL